MAVPWLNTVGMLALAVSDGSVAAVALPGLVAASGEAFVPLPSSAMMGLALIGGALLFGRVRPKKGRRRRRS